jgi:signal transduction histidine kinase
MNIRKKIVLYFSSVTIVLLAAALIFIYTLFSRFREEEFQQRQVEKIRTTLKFLTEIRNIDQNLIEAMDRITIHDIYDEKLLIFDKSKKLVYSSIDDTRVTFSSDILSSLSAKKPLIEQQDGLYDVTGIYLEKDDKGYYGISKAYDISGYAKLDYLRYVLTFTLVGICLAVILIANYLSAKITRSIVEVTRQINSFTVGTTTNKVVTTGTSDEVSILAQRFNELMQRMNEAFAFQKHAVHHISHELKTPIAILLSDIERMEHENDTVKLHQMISVQKENTKSLGEIINSLLEIAKTESGNAVTTTRIRVDEMIFDLIASFRALHPEFQFAITYAESVVNDDNLSVSVNDRLFRSALTNLMQNCIHYSKDAKAGITIATTGNTLQLDFTNRGKVIAENEQAFLFRHFFRGANSQGKRGFGLGLVFISKILSLHRGTVAYAATEGDLNTFSVILPLR